ncbi:GDP/GTP exchange factor for ARF [Pichia californica]|uniref:GDP/GTP exchange factor for ARF n=1 Tax=Pichia californica TaxID=460514 RepID=A0A9P7BCH6_9ASCO|nr:GDP/GTP exchange factor for ARF [[Candida] californica]
MDPLAFVIQECTFILSAMRKNNKSSSSPFAAILLNQFLNDNTHPDDNNLSNTFNTIKNPTNINKYPRKFKDDDHFLSGFVELRSILSETHDISLIDIITLLQPFLVVIKSPSISCHITNLAISSLSKFLNYNIINSNQSNIVQALSQIVSTLAHCRFEGADQTQDDLLLVKIIQLFETLVTSPLGDLLTDDSMYEIISTCFSLAINTRRRDMLRSSAETSLLRITQILFSKLKDLESKPEIDHNTKSAQLEFTNDSLPMDTMGGSTTSATINQTVLEKVDVENDDKIKDEISTTTSEEQITSNPDTVNGTAYETHFTQIDDEPDTPDSLDFPNKDADLSPYGIACMREFLNHTVDILLPDNRYRFTEGTRALALEILITIVEVTGSHITKHSQLFSLISDNCCHHIVQIIQHSESMLLVNLSLKLVLYFVTNFPNFLKIQLELIFNTIFQSIVANETMLNADMTKYRESVFDMSRKGKFETNSLTEAEITELKKEFETGKSPQSKEFLIESLSVLWCRSPYLFINMFKSYDCDFDRTDLTSSLIKLLCRLSYSDCSLLTTGNVPPICLDGLLSFVNGIYDRIKIGIKENVDLSKKIDSPLIHQYTKKSDFIDCVKTWNEKPEKGLDVLKDKGFIKDSTDNKEVANFLLTNSGSIDKKKLGELLAKPAKIGLLREFVGLLDFKNLRPDESLRLLLNYFRLPGEAQQIDRIVSTFNERYIECQDPDRVDKKDINTDERELETSETTEVEEKEKEEEDVDDEEEKVLPDSDAMYVLSFSIIMLNTDLHNPNVKKPMTLEDYQRNLRGCYKGRDFPHWYTEKMYNSIKEKEIIMPEEHKGTAKWFETVWHSLVAEQDSKRTTDSATVYNTWSEANDDITNLLLFDKLLFEKHCEDLITSFIIMFDDATHDSIVTKMMSTVEKCAAIAIYFGMDEFVDQIIEITSHLSTLTGVKKSEYIVENRGDILPIIEMTTKGKDGEQQSIYVSDTAVLFGRDYRAQLSMIILFRILKRSKYKVTKGWFYAVKALLKLYEIGLINPNTFEDFQDKLGFDRLSKPPGEYNIKKSEVMKDNGLFSTFSSYLKGLSDDTPEPTHEEIEVSLAAIEFIDSTGINNLFLYVSKTKDHESINKLVQVLLALLPHKNETTERFYVQETLFILELIVCFLLITKSQKLISQVFSKFDAILAEDNKNLKMSTVCRILSYKLLLVHVGSDINHNVLVSILTKLHELSTTSKESFVKHGATIILPLEQLAITENSWCCKAVVLKNVYWTILRVFASSPKNTETIYQFIYNIINEHPTLIEYNNYMDILGLLDEISAVGAYGAQWEHEYDKLIDSGLKVENNKNPYQELVNTALQSITLTSQLSEIVKNDTFIASMKEKESSGVAIVNPWYPLIEAISHQCYNPCRQLRAQALSTMTSLLINSNKLPFEDLSLDKILDAACLRLLVELMKPEVNGTDVKGMIKTQRDVLGLSCKMILTFEFPNVEGVVDKLFAISSQLLQKNRTSYPNSGHEDEIIELLRNVLMIKKDKLDLIKLKGYKMDGALKKLVEEVIKIVSASSASIRAILLQLTSIYIRTPAKLFRPARFDYLTVSRMLLANELAGKPYHIFTHSSPALLYESVKRLGWQFIPNQVLPPIFANCAIGVVLYSTYLTFLQYFTANRGWKWTIAGVPTGEGTKHWYSWVFSFYDSFRAGFIAGAISSIAASPIDALYSRSNYAELVDSEVKDHGLYKYAWKKLKDIGIIGIFAGFWLNLVKESFGFGFYFSVFEVIKSQGYSRTKSVIDWFDRIRGLEIDPNDVNNRKSARALQLTFVLFAGASAASALIAVQYPFNKVQKIHLARLEALDIFNEANKIESSKWFRLYYNSYKQTFDILMARKMKSGMTWPQFMYKGFTRFTLTNIPATSIGLLVFEITRQKLSYDLQESLKEKLEA